MFYNEQLHVITANSWTCSILSTCSLLAWCVSAEGLTSTYIMYHPLHGCTYSCVEEGVRTFTACYYLSADPVQASESRSV
jgi:hypothetical protein